MGDTVDTHAPHDDVTTFLLLVSPRFKTQVRPWLLRFSEMVFASVGLSSCLVIFGLLFAILVLHSSLYLPYTPLSPDFYHRALEFSLLLQAFTPLIAWIRIYA
jgi:hypothetical protein